MTRFTTTSISALLLFFFLFATGFAEENQAASNPSFNQAVIKIDGMKGQHCAEKVKSSLSTLEGVSDCEVNFEQKRATVTYDNGKLKDAQLVEAIKKAGYEGQISELKAVAIHQDQSVAPSGKAMICPQTGKSCTAEKNKESCEEYEKGATDKGDKK